MKLSFYAKEDQLVPVPGAALIVGQPAKYVGRKHALNVSNGAAGYPATEAPFVCDSASDVGRRLVQLTARDRCLIPADEETAHACGVAYTPHMYIDGAFVPID